MQRDDWLTPFLEKLGAREIWHRRELPPEVTNAILTALDVAGYVLFRSKADWCSPTAQPNIMGDLSNVIERDLTLRETFRLKLSPKGEAALTRVRMTFNPAKTEPPNTIQMPASAVGSQIASDVQKSVVFADLRTGPTLPGFVGYQCADAEWTSEVDDPRDDPAAEPIHVPPFSPPAAHVAIWLGPTADAERVAEKLRNNPSIWGWLNSDDAKETALRRAEKERARAAGREPNYVEVVRQCVKDCIYVMDASGFDLGRLRETEALLAKLRSPDYQPSKELERTHKALVYRAESIAARLPDESAPPQGAHAKQPTGDAPDEYGYVASPADPKAYAPGKKPPPPSRVAARATWEWAMSNIPGAEDMKTIAEVYEAIEIHPDLPREYLNKLPPNAEAFGVYLRQAGIKRYNKAGERQQRITHYPRRGEP